MSAGLAAPPLLASRSRPGRRRRNRLLPAADAAALALAVSAAVADGVTGWTAAVPYAVAVFVLLRSRGVQRPRISPHVGDLAPNIAVCATVPTLLLLPAAPSGVAAAAAVPALASGLLVTGRIAARRVRIRAVRRGGAGEPTVLVGGGDLTVRLARVLGERPELGLTPYGFVAPRGPRPDSPVPLLGDVGDLPGIVAAHGIERVIVCFPEVRDADLVGVLRAVRGLGAEVSVVPRLYELGMAVPRAGLDDAWGIPLVPLRRPVPGGPRAKRAFDLVAGSLLLAAASPLILAIALALRREHRGSVLFRQDRVGRRGAVVRIVKFRTVVDPEEGFRWTVAPEQCSRLGRLLRSSHLDELPQLVNVLRGEMSLVGPRPERPYFAAGFSAEIPRYADRHRVVGGVTGWAQAHGLSGDTSIEDRTLFDNHYIEYWSPWMDAMALACTLPAVVSGMRTRR